MSKHNRYIEQFEKNAGKPSDFDSLFAFEDNELIAKKRIRVRKKNGKYAAMAVSAAALVLVSAIALTTLDRMGSGESGISELSTGDSITPRTASQTTDPLALSNLIDTRFEYTLSDDNYIYSAESSEKITDLTKSTYLNSDIILKGYVFKKEYDSGITYTVYPHSYYYRHEISDNCNIVTGEPIEIISTAWDYLGSYAELQTGNEYIIPVNISENENGTLDYSYSDQSCFAIRKTEQGWMLPESFEQLAYGAETVTNDITNYFDYGNLCVVKDTYEFDLFTALGNLFIYEHSNVVFCPANTNELYISPIEFTGRSIDKSEVSADDSSVLLMTGEGEVFSDYNQTVVYSGTNLNGELILVLSMNNDDIIGICSGFEKLLVESGTVITDYSIAMAELGSQPAYCRLFNENGELWHDSERSAIVGYTANVYEITAVDYVTYAD